MFYSNPAQALSPGRETFSSQKMFFAPRRTENVKRIRAAHFSVPIFLSQNDRRRAITTFRCPRPLSGLHPSIGLTPQTHVQPLSRFAHENPMFFRWFRSPIATLTFRASSKKSTRPCALRGEEPSTRHQTRAKSPVVHPSMSLPTPSRIIMSNNPASASSVHFPPTDT
jgi:hypothetical protein